MNRILLTLLAVLLSFAPLRAHAEVDAYSLDKLHTQIIFSVSHLGLVESFGKFTDYKGEFTIDRTHPEHSTVDVTIMTGGIDMGDEKLEDMLRSPDYFNTARYPVMTFKSTHSEITGPDTSNVTGDLTLLGVTKPVTLNVHLNKIARHPFIDTTVAGLSADGVIRRSDFGMTSGLPLIGNTVTIHLEIEGASNCRGRSIITSEPEKHTRELGVRLEILSLERRRAGDRLCCASMRPKGMAALRYACVTALRRMQRERFGRPHGTAEP